MSPFPLPPADLAVMAHDLQRQFILMQLPPVALSAAFCIWGAVVNAAAPMMAGALVYRMLPYIKPMLRPVTIYAVALSNAMVMGGAALPMQFALNTNASLLVTHWVGVLTISLACFIVYVVMLAVATDASAIGRQRAGPLAIDR